MSSEQQTIGRSQHRLTPVPPMGWNSFDSYGCAASATILYEQLEAMAVKLQPSGYEYFVVDNGWFGEYTILSGERFPRQNHAEDVRLDAYGRFQPSRCNFLEGLQPLIDRTHALGMKFGIHLMRGIPRKAVDLNLPIKGTPYRAAEIANLSDTCPWCPYTYGVDMSKPGAQAYYDSVIDMFASWGVDFLKADDITGFPDEIEALASAIERCGRDMVLSLSPGGQTVRERLPAYKKANMLRTTTDIWDNRRDLDKAFEKWEMFGDVREEGFWLDLDMIPFGHLQVWKPVREDISPAYNEELSGKGFERMSGLTQPQKLTFLTIRAMAASPLFMGGDLITSDENAFKLVTNAEMIACNQNGVMGHLVEREAGIEIWHTPAKHGGASGWIGVFNRTALPVRFSSARLAGLLAPGGKWLLTDIWKGASGIYDVAYVEEIAPDSVWFLAYRRE